MNWKIPLSDIDFGEAEKEAVINVIESRWLTMGAVTQAFEEEFAAYIGSKHAVAVTNATAALHLACVVADLQPGDEVILPSLTFVATANAVRYVGATPKFADITSEDDFNISPASIRKNITPRTKAIIVVHYGGYPCAMPEIMSIANEHSLIVIEDAAHAAGAKLNDRALGNWGAVGCYSFFSNKNMTTGEGGMLTTNDTKVFERLNILRSHGMSSLTWDRHKGHAWSYDVTDLGYNYRIDEIRAALGRVQLSKLDKFNARRKELTHIYRDALAEIAPDVTIPFSKSAGESAYHILPMLLPENADRRTFIESMKTDGIQTSMHYPPIHQFQSFKQANIGAGLGITESISLREITLPLFPKLTEDDVLTIAHSVATALSKARG
jgi:dTDP-4-amino-4,6-dideoxygalactose transaminase